MDNLFDYLLSGYIFLGVIAALVIIIVWLRSKFKAEDVDAMDKEDGCALVITLVAVFSFLVFFWLPALIAIKISDRVSNSEEDEVEEVEE